MKISAISDVHIKFPNDDADKLFSAFLNHPDVKSSDYIVLLGDIFDLMCGPHKAYLKKFEHIFLKLTELQRSGVKVYFLEGNHDVHLKKLFDLVWKKNEVILTQSPIIETINDRTYYFSHGDEHEVDNYSYQRYIKFIRTAPLRFVANYVMPYSVLNFIGERASKVSRKKGSKLFDSEGVKSRFRSGVTEVTRGQYDFILGGHSHVQDKFFIPNSNSLYINNGYALRSKTFILIENHEVVFQEISV